MDQKTLAIVKAGWAMFARYGFAKTTMSDIASEAGVARQTVYNAFSSKEDILCAVVRHAGEVSLASVKSAWVENLTPEEALDAFQTLGPLSWYEAMRSAPDWAELMDGVHKAASAELRALEDKWVTAIKEMLGAHIPKSIPIKVSPEEVAVFFYTTSKNAKFGVRDAAELKSRLKIISQATMALIKS